MQNIAAENNLAETAFLVEENSGFRIRWFTPEVEVDLCGHATLASAHALFHHQKYAGEKLTFQSRSGLLTVRKDAEMLVLNFPTDRLEASSLSQKVLNALSAERPLEVIKGKTDYMVSYEKQSTIESMKPDFTIIDTVDARGIIVTAPGNDCDFVSRFFAPQSGINEDPVTGSAHTTLIPYWSKKLSKTELQAKQLSKRGGQLFCKYLNDRVEIGGRAVTFLEGEIEI
jgi:PhzF family phenazine biosynthesis protein